MTVNDLPLAVLAPVDMRDAQGVRLEWSAIPRHRSVLVSGRIGQVPTDACGDEVEAVCRAVGEPRRQPAKELACLIPAGRVLYRSEHCHWFVRGLHRHAWFRVAVVNRAFRLELMGKGGREEIVEFAHLARPLNRYCRQADRLSKTLLDSDRKRRAIDGEELAINCARNAEGLTC